VIVVVTQPRLCADDDAWQAMVRWSDESRSVA
jgi:hypothetical protein